MRVLSPRYHDRQPSTNMVLLGTSKETQKTQAPTSAVSPPNPIAHHEFQREENIGAVNNTILSQNMRHYSSPTSSNSENLSFVSPVSSPGISTTLPISHTKTPFAKPAVQEWSSNHNNPLRATTLLPWVQASPSGYVSQVAIPESHPSHQLQQQTSLVASLSRGQPTQEKASQLYLDTSFNSLKPSATYIAYSLPLAQPPTTATQYSGSERPLSPVVHSAGISSCQAISPESSCLPRYTLQTETQNFSATNTFGPINAFELYSDPEPQSTPGNCNRALNESLRSQQAGLEPSQSTNLSQHSEQNQSPRATDLDSAVATERLAETIAGLSLQRPESQVSVAHTPNNLVFAQSQSGDSFKELSTSISWEQTAISRFEMPGNTSTDDFVWPDFTTKVPPAKDNDMDELCIPRQRAVSHASTFMGMSPPTDPQLSRSQYQYHQSTGSWAKVQAQVPRTQPNHTQYQYQAYAPQSPVFTFRNATSSVVPPPILSEQGHWAGSASTSPPLEAAIQVPLAASVTEQGHPLSRSITAGEARRRNRKTLLNLMGLGVTGDKESFL